MTIEEVKYATPYYLDVDTYIECFHTGDYNPVYVINKEDDEVEVAVYSDDLTIEIDRAAWLNASELFDECPQDAREECQDAWEEREW